MPRSDSNWINIWRIMTVCKSSNHIENCMSIQLYLLKSLTSNYPKRNKTLYFTLKNHFNNSSCRRYKIEGN